MRAKTLKTMVLEPGKSARALTALGALLTLILLPALIGAVPLVNDNALWTWQPYLSFIARSLHEGIVPFWDPHTFCGAVPAYLRGYGPHYFGGLPGLLLASPSSPRSVYWWGLAFPIWLGYLLAAAGAFRLGRKAVGLGVSASALLAIAYIFSAPVITRHEQIYSSVAIPWWLLGITLYLRDSRPRSLFPAALAFLIGLPLSLGGLIAAAAAALSLVLTSKIWSLRHPREFGDEGVLHRCLLVVLLGLAVTAPFWTAAAEKLYRLFLLPSGVARAHLRDGGWFSLDYFASAVSPWFFDAPGKLAGWKGGAALIEESPCRLPGGLPVLFLAFLTLPWRRRREPPFPGICRYWLRAAAALLLLSLVMSVDLPIGLLRGLFRAAPLLSVLRGAAWLPLMAFSWAVCAGIGFEAVVRSRVAVTAGKAAVFVALAVLILLAGVLLPPGSISQFRAAGLDPAFFIPPLLAFAVFSVLLLAAARLRSRSAQAHLLFFSVVAFGLMTALVEQYLDRRGAGAPPGGPATLPLAGPGAGDVAWTGTGSLAGPERAAVFSNRLADLAYMTGGYAGNGYPNDLLDYRAEVTFMGKSFPGKPGEGIGSDRFARTLSNLGVGYLWLDAPLPPGDGWIPLKGDPGKTGWWYHTDRAMPRVYTLDRLHPVGEMDALYQLTNQDNRELVVVEGSYQELSGIMGNYRWPLRRGLPDDRQNRMIERYFNELQGLNRVHGFDFTDPNKVSVEIEIRQPAMMVVGDYRHPFWRAEVDGETVPIYRVNYILRGIWLDAGMRRVEMAFTPWHIWGAYLVMVLALVVLTALFFRTRRRAAAPVD